MNANSVVPNKKYKIKLKDSKKIKAKIYEMKNDSVFFKKKRYKKAIALSEIKSIKIGKFSYLKTIGFSVGTLGVYAIVYYACCGDININMGEIDFPN